MEKTLINNTTALILKRNIKPFNDKIVVYEINNQNFLKRVKGKPGDTIRINKLGIEAHNEILQNMIISTPNRNIETFSEFNNRFLDNYVVPFKGLTIPLNKQTLSIYKHLIEIIEGCEFEEIENKYYLCNSKISKYTFPENTYYLMGDNRSNSRDSRYFGAIPASKIKGEYLFTLFTPRE
jgi:signal peptidase I